MAVPEHFAALTRAVLHNLEYQHDWTKLETLTKPALNRQIVYGLPPTRLYTHPDEQIEIIKAEKQLKTGIPQPPEHEWVLPTHISEKWTLNKFAAVFDAIEAIPPGASSDSDDAGDGSDQWKRWRSSQRGKRVLLAIVQDDSTIVYYLMHDGIVKPRPN